MRWLLLMVAVWVGSASAGADDLDRAADVDALRVLKLETWPSFYKNQDHEGLAEFLAEDFVFILNDGSRSTYLEEIEWVENNPWSGSANDDFVYTIEDIAFQSNDVAIIYGKGTSTRETEDGRPCAHSYWSSNVIRRQDGRWRPSFSHVSGAICTPIE